MIPLDLTLVAIPPFILYAIRINASPTLAAPAEEDPSLAEPGHHRGRRKSIEAERDFAYLEIGKRPNTPKVLPRKQATSRFACERPYNAAALLFWRCSHEDRLRLGRE